MQRSILLTGALILCATLPTVALGQTNGVDDIATFKLVDVDGSFTARYLFDDQERGSTTSADSFEERVTWEEELSFMTRSYVYHPGFLNMDIGGGPLLVQQGFDSNAGTNDNNEALLNFLARFNFLDLKKYPFSFFYQRSHPSITTSLSGRFLTENNRYGFTGTLYDFWGSSNVRIDLARGDTNGEGLGNVINEDVEDNSVAFVKNYREEDKIELRHHWSRRDSSSGSLGLPIQQSIISLDDSEVRARNAFGTDGKFVLTQFFRRLQQTTETDTTSELDNRIYMANGRWNFSDKTRAQVRYNYNDIQRIGSDSSSQMIDMRIARNATEDLSYDVGVGLAETDQTGFSKDVVGARGSFAYSRATGFGSIGVAGGVQKERTDQTSDADTIQVLDESVILAGTATVPLANDFVIASSVVVSNANKTQVYIEDLDYRLVLVGSTTSIQRLINGNIQDGELVLVDYRYQTSGTAKFDALDSHVSMTLGFFKYFTAFSRLTRRDTEVLDGQLTLPLNDLQSIELGAGVNLPLVIGWTLDGQIRRVDQDKGISPFVRDSMDIGLTGGLRGSLRLRLSGGLIQVDYRDSVEDVDQVNYTLGVSGRIFRRVQFDLGSRFLRDTGGTLERRQLQHRANFQWVYRQVRFALRAQVSDETLGETNRTSTQVTAYVTRVF